MISTFKKVNCLIFFSLLVCGWFLPMQAMAQEAITFSISPTIFDMTANPGQTWKSSIRVINANPFDLTVSVEVTNFVPKGEGGTPSFVPVTQDTPDKSTLAQWITTDKQIVIPAEQTSELPLNITIPNDASPGGQFAAILISTQSAGNQSDNTKVVTSQVITSLIFLRVSGDVDENSTIRAFRTTDYILSRPAATFELRVENSGNVHVQPQGEIKIFNMWGQERGVIPINQQTLFGNVLPNSIRKYSFSWAGDWSMSDIGRYKAVATLAYGLETRQFMTAETNFWIVPWKIILLILSIIIGFIMLVSWAIKLYVSKMLLLAGLSPGQVQTNTTLDTKVRKTVSVVAPLEAGILDLRTRFTKSNSVKDSLTTGLEFIRLYWVFFVVFISAMIFLSGVIWFVQGAATPSRDYEVSIEGEGHSVKISSPDDSASTQADSPKETDTSTELSPTISIVNRSGNETAAIEARQNLIDNGYAIDSFENDFVSLEEKTVIVYNPDFAEQALSLSLLLENALLSAFLDDTSPTDVTVYLGTDAISSE